ncbi:DMT family transporter [Arenicellales bacterium nBUS_48]|jgi:drug/metabolite transporter (DMT)-like permease|nr:DMT family transporter [Pseudomonadota bacterium]
MEITTKNNLRSAGAVVLAMTAVTASDAMVKGMLDDIPPFQFLFVRAIVILLILGTALAIKGQRILMPGIRQPFALLRGGFELMSTGFWLFGLQFIALPTAAALAWTSPIMVALLGIFILKEANSVWRWLAVLMGFIGVLFVTKPWGAEWSLLLMLPIAASLASAARELSTRFISQATHPLQIAFITVLVTALGSGIGSIFLWQPLTWDLGIGILISALLVSAAFPLMIVAVRHGEMSFIAPFFFSAIPVAIILGYLIWGDTLDFLATLGVFLIVTGGWLNVKKSSHRSRQSS